MRKRRRGPKGRGKEGQGRGGGQGGEKKNAREKKNSRNDDVEERGRDFNDHRLKQLRKVSKARRDRGLLS